MPYVYVIVFVIWNIVMASIITIPLYKIICNIPLVDTYVGGVAAIHKVLCVISQYSTAAVQSTYACPTWYTNDVHIPADAWLRLQSQPRTMMDSWLSSVAPSWSVEMCSLDGRMSTGVWLDDDSFIITFMSRVSNLSLLELLCLQEHMQVKPGESGLAFFRIYNPIGTELSVLGMYSVYPGQMAIYVNKVQCFCFDQLVVRVGETIELPVLLFLDKSVYTDPIASNKRIYISYVLFIQ